MVSTCTARRVLLALPLVARALAAPTVATAADLWTEVRSPHFTVITNGSEGRGRDVAWQFEQIRGAMEKGWSWTRTELDRPVLVLALKDAASMKVLAPDLFRGKNSEVTWTSALITASDRHIVALRADVLGEDLEGRNPYLAAYWSYSELALQATFGRGMPLWLSGGLSGVLSNSIVRKTEIHFGRPLPDYIAEVRHGVRVSLRDLLTATKQSPMYADPPKRPQFDAQSWAFVQYLLFADPQANSRLPKLMQLISEHVPSVDAIAQVYGRIESLEEQYLLYMKNPIFRYAQLRVDSDVTKQKYPTTIVSPAAMATLRAEFYLARGLKKEMQSAIEQARAADASWPGSFDVQALATERDGRLDDATRLYERAVELGSMNFHSYYRLASLRARQSLDADGVNGLIQLLDQAVVLNPNFAPSLHFLADIHERQRRLVPAFDFAQRAAKADPTEARYWLSVARILATEPSRAADVRRIAEDALKFAVEPEDRAGLQQVLDSLSRASSAVDPSQAAAGGRTTSTDPFVSQPSVSQPPLDALPTSPGALADVTGQSPVGDRLRGTSTNPALRAGRDSAPPRPPGGAGSFQLQEPPKIRTKVEPVYPAGLDKTKDFGTVMVSILIAPDGTVTKASVKGQASKFDAAALDAVRQWVYEPVLVDGKPVGVMMDVPVNFGF